MIKKRARHEPKSTRKKLAPFSVDGYGMAAAFPLYEEDNITGICNDSPVADVVQTMLGQIDFSQSMSCVSL